jgi:hypothetical protein
LWDVTTWRCLDDPSVCVAINHLHTACLCKEGELLLIMQQCKLRIMNPVVRCCCASASAAAYSVVKVKGHQQLCVVRHAER